MNKFLLYLFSLSLLLSLTACNSRTQSHPALSDYQNDDVAAIVQGEEMTIGDLRFLYPDDKVLDNITGAVKLKLIEQEVKKLELDIADEEKQQKELLELAFSSEGDPAMRDFIDSQAEKLGMPADEYAAQYADVRSTIDAHLNAYLHELTRDAPLEGEKEKEEYDETVNKALDQLVKDHEGEIEILIERDE